MKRCSECDAEMDAHESVCPQCGHGLAHYAERKRQEEAAKPKPAPAIDLADLAGKWPDMAPPARRAAIRARIRGTERGLLARLGKLLGMAPRPRPPVTRRAAARALALAGTVGRALQEIRREEGQHRPLVWLQSLGVAGELEPQERAFLQQPIGRADQAACQNVLWRVEGLAVLAWALNRFELPAYDEAVSAESVLECVGYTNAQVAREVLAGLLRPSAQIDRFAAQATVVTWRLRQFRLFPGPWDFLAHLRGFASFKDAWLEGLRIQEGDLAVGARGLANASPEAVDRCERIALERHKAAYWLQGDDAIYSQVDPATLLSTC